MTASPYEFDPLTSGRFTFTSVGKKSIEKVVDFIPTGSPNVMNLSFGDRLPDGSIDFMTVSDNGDIRKVLATVVAIVNHFTFSRPEVAISFTGSTVERTKLYKRILKTYYPIFSKLFTIWGLIKIGDDIEGIPFHPEAAIVYFGFLIKRID
jgi:hypothetical protein